jgi:hypothetical protein
MAKIIFPVIRMALLAPWSGMTGAPTGRAVLLAP